MASDDTGSEGRSIKFVFPSIPPSVNGIYEIVWRRKEVNLRPEARQWKSNNKQYVPRFEIAETSLLRIDFVFHYPFFHANGNLRDFDSPNLLKLAVDCIAEKLAIRDKRVKAGSWHSVDEPKTFTEVVLSEHIQQDCDRSRPVTNNPTRGEHKNNETQD